MVGHYWNIIHHFCYFQQNENTEICSHLKKITSLWFCCKSCHPSVNYSFLAEIKPLLFNLFYRVSRFVSSQSPTDDLPNGPPVHEGGQMDVINEIPNQGDVVVNTNGQVEEQVRSLGSC